MLRVDDRRHQLCCQKADLLLRKDCVLKLYLIDQLCVDGLFLMMLILAIVLCWMSHGMSTSHVRSLSMVDPSLGLSNRHR